MTDLARRVRQVALRSTRFADDGTIPNNPTLPFLVYPAALDLDGPDPAAIAEAVFAANSWGGLWRNGIFSYPHYHSTAHEALAVCAGEARVRFGGGAGETLDVQAGDVVIIPAGVGHQNLTSRGLLVVGAYPQGQNWDLCTGRAGERPRVLRNIAAVPLPTTDPVYGAFGPLLDRWSSAG